jgi:hypothetical protein
MSGPKPTLNLRYRQASSVLIGWLSTTWVRGSANAVLDLNGVPCMYADLGGGVIGHATSFPADFKRLCLTPTIVLSHWDWDHWSSAGRFPAAQTMTWIVQTNRSALFIAFSLP